LTLQDFESKAQLLAVEQQAPVNEEKAPMTIQAGGAKIEWYQLQESPEKRGRKATCCPGSLSHPTA
jgi:hypothetical protein